MDILFYIIFFNYTPFQQIGWWNVMSLILIDLMKVKFMTFVWNVCVIIYYVYAFVKKIGHA
jgi:hypothetical protein